MSNAGGRRATGRKRAPAAERPLPFWLLQLAEVLGAIVLVEVSIHVRGGGTLVAAAIGYALLAALSRGPLGLVRLCPQPLHVVLVVAVAALAGAAPLVPRFRPDIEGILVLEFATVGIIRMATLTRTSEPAGSAARARVIDARASVVDRAPSPPRPGPPTRPDGATPARRAGRATGAAAATGRRLVETHGPTAKAHLKRSIRTAGRWAGRFRARAGDDGPGSGGAPD